MGNVATLADTAGDGDIIYVRGQLSLDPEGAVLCPGDIAEQTRNAFRGLQAALRERGADLADLVRLNTYYVYDGPEEQATTFWEAMTRVRLEFLPDPGPAATAVRVAGDGAEGLVIQFEGAALRPGSAAERHRLMPDDCWDWSIPVPLSQGWRIGDRTFAGGQISCDMQGRATDIDDLDAQIANTWRFIDAVMREGGGSSADVCAMRICYLPEGNTDGPDRALQRILDRLGAHVDSASVAISAFGVDLLYEGLKLEIDVEAVPGRTLGAPVAPGTGLGAVTHQGGRFWCPARYSGTGPETAQIDAAMDAILRDLQAAGGDPARICKVNVYARNYTGAESAERRNRALAQITERLGDARPAITYVEVTSLPEPGATIQIDAVIDTTQTET